ncbi:hypothetical protein FO519_003435 [Halicephalobus sp. NKZ332]|nr:hypothetical protein FO519_003435 [Halicephalobus sp. NKZ332]
MVLTNIDLNILLPLVYIIPTHILYIGELFTMFINRKGTKFAGSFFNIWVSSATNNLVCSILYFLTYRGTKAPALVGFYSILPESGFFITLALFIVYIAGSAQLILDLVLCFNRMGAADTDILILLPLVYIIPTYILYIVELFTMFVNRRETKFASYFFNIWVSSATNNIICSVLFFLASRGLKAPALIGFYSILPGSGFFVTLIIFTLYCNGATQVILDLILCFNRFTVVWMGTGHVPFWRKYCNLFLFAAFFFPVLTSWEAWFFDVKLYPVNASDLTQGYSWIPTNPTRIPWMSIPLIVSGTVVVTASLSFLMNCYVCWYLLKQRKNKNGKNVISKQDLKLFLYNLLIFFSQAVQFCLQFFVMDVNSLAPAWFILLMSSALRASIMDVFGFKVIMTNTDLFILLPLIYIIPTYMLYLVELFVIFINRKETKFTSNFFNIWVSSAINNLICSLLFFLTSRGSSASALSKFYSDLPESGFFITLMLFIVYCSGASQVIFDLILCFNRFTVVWLEARHVAFWKKYCTVFLFLGFFFPVSTSWETWFFEVKLLPINASDFTQGFFWSPTNFNAIPWMSLPLIVSGTATITATLSFLMNCYVCWYLLEQKKNKNGSKMISKNDTKLFFYNILIFLTQLVQLSIQMIFMFYPQNDPMHLFAIRVQYFVMDVNSLAPAWFILLMSSALRVSITGFFSTGMTPLFMMNINSINTSMMKTMGRFKMAMTDIDFFILLPLVYIIPTYMMYFVELFILFVNRKGPKFTSNFFIIWITSAINNLVCCALFFLTSRGVRAPILSAFYSGFPKSGFFTTSTIFILYCSGAAQVILDLVLCFNRFTVVWLGSGHVPFWNNYCKIILFIAFFFPVLMSWEAWFFDVRIFPVNATDITQGFVWIPTNPTRIPWMSIPLLVSGTATFTATLSFLMNCYVCCYLLEQNENKSGSKMISKNDAKLFFYNVLIFLTQLVQLSVQMVFMFCPANSFIYLFFIRVQYFVMDVNSLAPAWFILLMSSTLRTAITGFFSNRTASFRINTISTDTNVTKRMKSVTIN